MNKKKPETITRSPAIHAFKVFSNEPVLQHDYIVSDIQNAFDFSFHILQVHAGCFILYTRHGTVDIR
jgi:hypothetical protein